MIGQVFDRLTVTGWTFIEGTRTRILVCRCLCGQEKLVMKPRLTSGLVKSCGCKRRQHAAAMRSPPPQRRDISGITVGRLTAIEPLPRGTSKHTLWRCACACGSETIQPMTKLVGGQIVSCGCWRRERSAARAKVLLAGKRGPEHPLWKPELPDEERLGRRIPEVQMWSKAVLRRDGYRCVACGARRRFHAHHLRSYRAHPELRTDLSNGVTVCVPCHKAYHKQFGTRTDFTAESFWEFAQSKRAA